MVNATMGGIAKSFLDNVIVNFFDKFVIAIIILLVGFIIGRIVGNLTRKALSELEVDYILKKAANIKRISLERIVSKSVEYLIYFIVIVITLNQLGLTTTALYIITGAIFLIIIVSFILAVKDFIPNLMAGFFIYTKKELSDGDRIKVGDVEGKIKHVGLIETSIETKSKDLMLVPNTLLTNSVVVKKKS